MSDVVVRATEEHDLPQVSDLTEAVFGLRRDPSLLRWLLGVSPSPEQVDSWVVERSGELVGHVGLLKCRYRVGHRSLTGVHPYLWMVHPSHRGTAGVTLARLIRRYKDFQIVLGGTATTKAIVAGRRFAQVAEAREYRMPCEPDGRATGLDLRPVERAAGKGAAVPAEITVNEAAPGHLDWLAGCPELEAHLYALERDGVCLGPVLSYVNRQASPVSGRLVHLPYLGDDRESWETGLEVVAQSLEDLGCRSWSLMAAHPALIGACEAADAEPAGCRTVCVREHEDVLGSDGRLWHLTYLEGDIAYRRV